MDLKHTIKCVKLNYPERYRKSNKMKIYKRWNKDSTKKIPSIKYEEIDAYRNSVAGKLMGS